MRLTLLLDQNVPEQVGNFLGWKRPDWLLLHVNEIGLRGAPDEVIFQRAQTEGAIVVTFDEDFADTRMYSRQSQGRHPA